MPQDPLAPVGASANPNARGYAVEFGLSDAIALPYKLKYDESLRVKKRQQDLEDADAKAYMEFQKNLPKGPQASRYLQDFASSKHRQLMDQFTAGISDDLGQQARAHLGGGIPIDKATGKISYQMTPQLRERVQSLLETRRKIEENNTFATRTQEIDKNAQAASVKSPTGLAFLPTEAAAKALAEYRVQSGGADPEGWTELQPFLNREPELGIDTQKVQKDFLNSFIKQQEASGHITRIGYSPNGAPIFRVSGTKKNNVERGRKLVKSILDGFSKEQKEQAFAQFKNENGEYDYDAITESWLPGEADTARLQFGSGERPKSTYDKKKEDQEGPLVRSSVTTTGGDVNFEVTQAIPPGTPPVPTQFNAYNILGDASDLGDYSGENPVVYPVSAVFKPALSSNPPNTRPGGGYVSADELVLDVPSGRSDENSLRQRGATGYVKVLRGIIPNKGKIDDYLIAQGADPAQIGSVQYSIDKSGKITASIMGLDGKQIQITNIPKQLATIKDVVLWGGDKRTWRPFGSEGAKEVTSTYRTDDVRLPSGQGVRPTTQGQAKPAGAPISSDAAKSLLEKIRKKN
jgi:hypothetical protein